jgi:hypothetical protein
MIPLDIIIRTHFSVNRDLSKPRYCGAEKSEVTRRCLVSLVRAVNEIKSHISVRITLYDDHSRDEDLLRAEEVLKKLHDPHFFEIIRAKESGPTATMVPAFTYLRENNRGGVIYSLEDDYLHEPEKNVVQELVDSLLFFKQMLGGRKVAIYPFNDPYRYYVPSNIISVRVVQAPGRHFRENYFTSGTFFTTADVLKDHFLSISALGRVPVSRTMEDDTINKVWKNEGVHLFTPIPSIALHLQFDVDKDPYIDWKDWWDAARRV